MPEPSSLRLRDAMPRPLMVLFLLTAVVALVAVAYLVIVPPRFEPVPVEDRRPPGNADHSHDVQGVLPASAPDDPAPLQLKCPELEGIRVIAGGPGVARLRRVLDLACTFSGPSLDEDTRAAVARLSEATIRFAQFRRTGVESTLETATSTIWLNIKLAATDLPVAHVVPVLLHEAAHLTGGDTPRAAADELRARRVEARACRELITPEDLPRWCEDAIRIAGLPDAEALALLARAGYAVA